MTPLKAFIVGSSLPATWFTLWYVGRAHKANKPVPGLPDYEFVCIWILIAYGLTNALAHSKFIKKFIKRDIIRMAVCGAFLGVILSSYGTFVGNFPVDMFGFSEKNWNAPLYFAPFLYAAIFVVIVHNINRIASSS